MTRGRESYLDVLGRTHHWLQPSFYLEIGVRLGRSLSLANCPAVGVDPDFDIRFPQGQETTLFRETSDSFFANRARHAMPRSPGLVFIDGMHLFEYALRDFINAESVMHPASLIVIDDVFPNHPLQASRNRQTKVWTGDVWKMVEALRQERKDLTLMLLDTQPSGLLFIAGLNSESQVLAENYDALVSRFSQLSKVPSHVLNRRGAIDPSHQSVVEFLRLLQELGREDAATSTVRGALDVFSASWRNAT